MKVLFLVSAAVYLVGLGAGHTYFTPLDFLRHERAQVKLGEIATCLTPTTNYSCMELASYRTEANLIQIANSTNQEPTSGNHQKCYAVVLAIQLETKHSKAVIRDDCLAAKVATTSTWTALKLYDSIWNTMTCLDVMFMSR